MRAVAVSRRVSASREAAWATGIASATSTWPVRRALVRAVPSAMNRASMPEAWARPPQWSSKRSRAAAVVPVTPVSSKGPVAVPTGSTVPFFA